MVIILKKKKTLQGNTPSKQNIPYALAVGITNFETVITVMSISDDEKYHRRVLPNHHVVTLKNV